MGKLAKRTGFVFLLVGMLCLGSLLSDRVMLNECLIRLHVVANSDSPEDQAIKLQVRDAVLDSLRQTMTKAADVEEARTYLQTRLPVLEETANRTLEELGCAQRAVVSFCKEAFPEREYDTFSLPGGIYNALRITIGEGKGHNWWCVVYPTLCDSATTRELESVAAGADFPPLLTDTLTGKEGTQYRFYLLDKLGEMEAFLAGCNR